MKKYLGFIPGIICLVFIFWVSVWIVSFSISSACTKVSYNQKAVTKRINNLEERFNESLDIKADIETEVKKYLNRP